MELDYTRQGEKESEIKTSLVQSIIQILSDDSDSEIIAQEIIKSSISISPPEKEQQVFSFITGNPSDFRRTRSIKPGNIRLNIKKLIDAVTSNAFGAVASYQVPWLAPFALLNLWSSFYSAATFELSENEAALIWTMWSIRNRSNNLVSKDGLLDKVNDILKESNRSELREGDYNTSIKNLLTIGSIKQTRNNDFWWLCEWISPSYR